MSVIKSALTSVLSLDMTTLLVFLAVLIVTYIVIKQMSEQHLPPGPPSLPIIGSVLSLNPEQSFPEQGRHLCEKYKSDIVSVNIYGRTTILLLKHQIVKEAFQKRDDMAHRSPRSFFKAMDPEHEGILAASGAVWKDTRRFTLFMLRDFGMGKLAAEESIQDEAVQLCNRINELSNTTGAFDPLPVLEPAVSNIICAMAFGKRFDYDDDDFMLALNALNNMIQNFSFAYGNIALSPTMYWLAPYVFPETTKKLRKDYAVFTDFVKKIIGEHRERFDGSVNDLIDGFFVELEKRKTEEEHCFTETQLRYLIQDLFLAGSETTTTTLRWCLLYLVKYPDIQQKIFEELDRVIGRERLPTMNDKKSTPYTDAFMLEIQRFNTIVPNAVAHSSDGDIEFHGYTIPKDSFIISNLAAIHRDPRVFTDPETFNVDRFLSDGTVVNADQVFQFGIGRRVCAGEALARMELYLFFTTLVLKFKFESADDTIDLSGMKSGIYAPKAYKVKAIRRDN